MTSTANPTGNDERGIVAAMDFVGEFLAATTKGPMWVCSLRNTTDDHGDQRNERTQRYVRTRIPDRIERFIRKRDEAGYGLFFCISTMTDGERRYKEHAQETPFATCDVDFKHIDDTPENILATILALAFPPSRVHRSGNGYHCFWKLDHAAGPDQHGRIERLLKRLAWLLGGDSQPTHAGALLRVVGSHNTKDGTWKEVVLVHKSDAVYSLDALEQHAASYSAPVIATRPGSKGADAALADNPFTEHADGHFCNPPMDVEGALSAMVLGENVNKTLNRVASSLTSKGMGEDEIVEFLLDRIEELIPESSTWNWKAQEREIRSMCQRFRRKIEAEDRRPKPLSSAAAPVSLMNARKASLQTESKTMPTEQHSSEAAPAFSDEALALSFIEKYPNVRFTDAWNKWFIFDGTRWKVDETRAIFSYARTICRDIARTVNAANVAKAIASSKTRNAVVSMASDDRRAAATVDQWDTDPWLLNTPKGTIDLRTGDVRPHRLEDYMTKITAVAPDPSCPTPLFTAFLDRIARGDAEYKSYLKRTTGYCLTGSTREHQMFFLYGEGRNGKGTLVNTVGGIMGDYHSTAPTETFMETKNERHPTDLAMLRGARLVTSSETEEGKSWAESLIKRLTGGDPIDARFMRQDFFRYTPQFKLVIQGNNKPSLKSVDVAIKSRLNMLPFTVVIPAEERDHELGNKMKAEWPGILHWMIEGCLEWQEQGLAPPAVVVEATDVYLDDQDAVAVWVDECCERDVNAFTPLGDLFGAWETWADGHGEFRGNRKRFSQRLEQMGFTRDNQRHGGGRGFRGIKGPSSFSSRSFSRPL